MASFHGQTGGAAASNKISKGRSSKVVKPILKKLSHSEKNSLDLDRGWDEQLVEQLDDQNGWAGGNYGSRSASARDVSFAVAAGVGDSSAGTGSSGGARKFQHGRSASQASTGSATRVGGFVHPFQQTPRTSTPPLSYANSLASFDNARDYSPTITENEDDDRETQSHSQPNAHPHAQTHHVHLYHPPPPTVSQSNLRRPSIASQRTSSFPDINTTTPPQLRVNTTNTITITNTTSTTKSTAGASSRLAHGSLNTSNSDLNLNLTLDSPTGSIGGSFIPPAIASPTSSVSAAPMSPIRSSLEAVGFPRLRSRSELDTAARAENIRAARRKFEERERAKAEKYDREMIRKRERRDTKEASRIEKESRKNSLDIRDAVRPSASRKTTPTHLSKSATAPAGAGIRRGSGAGILGASSSRNDLSSIGTRQNSDNDMVEKQAMDFVSRKYESVPGQTPPAFVPGVDDVRFEQARPRRGSGAKRKTQTYWQGFILWLRTKLLRMGGR
ncbi:hypothetical protein QBC46DRAFT_156006 [Diplogelasinospora grovesii]|uniref:Uncharacterized protein n=1 Tax=Diplogelasinospora grovesii TaxID=303347 RepID=A0AAN6N5I0_9PEZI|nr:hypothetical protein QBC46DRAFT_156006 [Diplogelasinospora grovesii]